MGKKKTTYGDEARAIRYAESQVDSFDDTRLQRITLVLWCKVGAFASRGR